MPQLLSSRPQFRPRLQVCCEKSNSERRMELLRLAVYHWASVAAGPRHGRICSWYAGWYVWIRKKPTCASVRLADIRPLGGIASPGHSERRRSLSSTPTPSWASTPFTTPPSHLSAGKYSLSTSVSRGLLAVLCFLGSASCRILRTLAYSYA